MSKMQKRCIHGKQIIYCRQCGGSSFCEHGKDKTQCRQCGGSSICEHGKRKTQCRQCGGTSFCEHGKRKERCRQCGGSSFCEHGKQRATCRQCGGSQLCKHDWCETRRNDKYEGYCLPCFVNNPDNSDKPVIRNYKTKERAVVENIREIFPNITWINDKRVIDGCSQKRPDLLCDIGSHVVNIEIDENNHSSYNCTCENKRLMQISQDLHHRPLVFIRFNPDDYINQDNEKVKSCWKLNKLGVMTIDRKREWKQRLNVLKEQVEYWLQNQPDKMLEVVELFYDQN